MAIKDPLMFITIEEFKNWKGFNKLEFDDTTTPDNEIWFAISVASNNIDYLSGYSISKKWPETTLTEFTDEIQTATAYYVRFLLTKDSNYIRGQSSISQGGMTYSENNPTDPYFIVPEVFNCLRKIKEYPNITGFNLNVLPKRNDFFSNFYSNYGEDSPFTRYVEITNLKSSDPRVEIKKIHQKNIIGTIVDIDTSGIKTDIDNSLWEVDKDNINFVKLKDDKGIDVNGKRIIDVGTPTFLSDATTKEYVDKKQDKLIAGENIKIDEKTNTISASGGSGQSLWETDPNSPNIIQPKEKRLITANNKRIVYIADPQQPQDAVNKRYVDKNLENKMDKENWKIIGESINNREYNNFKLWFDKLYRVLITWEKPPFNQVNTRIIVEFKTGKYLGGKAGDKIFLTQGEIDGIEANLYLVVVNANNFKLIIEGGNEKYGNIFSLEELQNTIKVNILPLNIISKTLNIKLLEKDAFNIELKDIPPTPSPSGSNWKEVGTKVNINHIKYTFKSNTKYKIYYNFESQSSNKKFAFMSKEFLYGELNTDVQTLYWDKVNERIIISLQMQNDTIAVVSDPTRYGQLLKLEELQE